MRIALSLALVLGCSLLAATTAHSHGANDTAHETVMKLPTTTSVSSSGSGSSTSSFTSTSTGGSGGTAVQSSSISSAANQACINNFTTCFYCEAPPPSDLNGVVGVLPRGLTLSTKTTTSNGESQTDTQCACALDGAPCEVAIGLAANAEPCFCDCQAQCAALREAASAECTTFEQCNAQRADCSRVPIMQLASCLSGRADCVMASSKCRSDAMRMEAACSAACANNATVASDENLPGENGDAEAPSPGPAPGPSPGPAPGPSPAPGPAPETTDE